MLKILKGLNVKDAVKNLLIKGLLIRRYIFVVYVTWKPYYGNLNESKFCDMGHGNKISNLQISNVNNSKGIEALIKEVFSLREEIKNIKAGIEYRKGIMK